MTVFEKNIKTMNINEFAEWLDQIGIYDGSPWMNWWNDTYCSKCESVRACMVDNGREMEFAWCELHNKCRFFQNMNTIPDTKQIIKLWLERECE